MSPLLRCRIPWLSALSNSTSEQPPDPLRARVGSQLRTWYHSLPELSRSGSAQRDGRPWKRLSARARCAGTCPSPTWSSRVPVPSDQLLLQVSQRHEAILHLSRLLSSRAEWAMTSTVRPQTRGVAQMVLVDAHRRNSKPRLPMESRNRRHKARPTAAAVLFFLQHTPLEEAIDLPDEPSSSGSHLRTSQLSTLRQNGGVDNLAHSV
ncbi:hypothetical protein BD311DRAFT_447707 [Dichomitus squalens]|uniref:Uncharacterized protein n=1 Tax=Dichomitus squalens TaxID=114155 RepID=A0A4Q9MID5_9APHY|nr:hypothetical protein BD311DRAFT_447707 [Dichomitus squalens]